MKAFAFFLLSTTTAIASPYGTYAYNLPCLYPHEMSISEDYALIQNGGSGCDVGLWQSRGDGWQAYLENCTSLMDNEDGSQSWQDPGWYVLRITPLPSGKYLFDMNDGDGYWTAYKCEDDPAQ